MASEKLKYSAHVILDAINAAFLKLDSHVITVYCCFTQSSICVSQNKESRDFVSFLAELYL